METKKKLIVDDSVCIGCGACVGIDNEHFDFNDDGISSVISQKNLESDDLQNAINSCPVSAIKILDACEGGCTCGCDKTGKCTCDNCNCGCEKEN